MEHDEIQKVVYLLSSNQYLLPFGSVPTFLRPDSVPFTPDDLLQSGTWRNAKTIGMARGFRQLTPAFLFMQNRCLLAKQQDTFWKLWYGKPILQQDIAQYPDMEHLAKKALLKERMSSMVPHNLLGYCMHKNSRVQHELLVVYTAQSPNRKLRHNERWVPLQDIPKIYWRLDTLSKTIFDAVYEDASLQKLCFV